ncbi:MAG: PIN domain-containing protein [Acidimicrobiales bacterium]
MEDDPDHARCAAFFEETSERLVLPQVVLAEAAYLVGKLAGPVAEAQFVRRLAADRIEFHCLDSGDLHRMANLMDTYADLRLGVVDAAVVATAERLDISTIATLDHRDFSVVRPRHVSHFELIP